LSSEAQPTAAEFQSFKARVTALRDKHWPRPQGAEGVREIFHYCDAVGLEGIVTSKCLWASDIFSLNDASEVDYARQIICEALSNYPDLNHITQQFEEPDFMEFYKSWKTHVCCFSAEGDLLSQWRAYGAQGHGFAIGFNSHLLKSEGDGPPPIFSTFPIVYSRDAQLASLKAFLAETMQFDGMPGLLRSSDVTLEIAISMLILMPPFKNPAFSDEREWRMMLIPDELQEIHFRPIRGAIVPYVKIPLKPEFFTRIVLGPTLHQEFAERSLKMFLAKNGLAHVVVNSSEIPFRSL
jgi:hypothetical protein